MLTVELHVSMCSLWSNQCVHCVGQTNCTVWGNQCAYYGAANVLTVEQPMCSVWSNQYASRSIQHSHNSSAATKPVNIKSTRPRALHAANRNQLCTFNDLMWGVVKGATVPSVMKMGHRRLHVIFRLRCGLLEGHGNV